MNTDGWAKRYTEECGWTLHLCPPRSNDPGMLSGQRMIGPGAPGGPRDIRPLLAEHPDWGLALMHGPSGTVALGARAAEADVARALAAVEIDYRALLAAPGPKIVGDPEMPPTLLYRAPEGLAPAREGSAWMYYDAPGLRRRTLYWPGLVFDLRGRGEWDLLPPSIDRDGVDRRWLHGSPRAPEDVPVLPPELRAVWEAWDEHLPAMRAARPAMRAAYSQPQGSPPASPRSRSRGTK